MRKEEPMTPKEMALLLAQALDSKKGKDIRVLETDSVTTLADYFVLCTGTSAPQLKALAEKYINTKEKQAVCKTVVAAVNQIYYDLDGPEKLQKAIESASEMLAAKGITVTELELRMLLEAAVNAAKGGTGNAVA